MKPIQTWLDEYGVSHQNSTNKLIHWICVPAIFFSIYVLVASVPNTLLLNVFPDVLSAFANWGNVVLVLVLLFYFRLSIPIGIGMLIFSVLCVLGYNLLLLITGASPWLIAVVIFVVAWIFQFIGHHIEGKKPSFLEDLQFLLIGPSWLLSFIYKKIGIKY